MNPSYVGRTPIRTWDGSCIAAPCSLSATFGLVPLYGHDVWLHAVLAAVAAWFGFMRPVDQPQMRRA